MSTSRTPASPWAAVTPALALLVTAVLVSLAVLDAVHLTRSSLRDIVSTAVSPDGRWVVYANVQGKLELHDIDAGTHKAYDAPGGPAYGLTILPRATDDRKQFDTLLYTSRDGALWRVSISRGTAKNKFTPTLVAIGGPAIRRGETGAFGAWVNAGDSSVALAAYPAAAGSVPQILADDMPDAPSIQPYGKRITSALPVSGEQTSAPEFTWPLAQGTYRSAGGFGQRRDPFTGKSEFHPGTDFAADHGTAVLASASGRVAVAERRGPEGLMIEVDHGGGRRTKYSHLQSTLVKANDSVSQGMKIATVGSSGRATGPHLHFEIWRNGVVQDSLKTLNEQLKQTVRNWLTGSADGTLALFAQTPQGPRLVSESNDGFTGVRQIVQLPSRDQVPTPSGWSMTEEDVVFAHFSPAGRPLLIVFRAGTVSVSDVVTRTLVFAQRHEAALVSAAFDPAGLHILTVDSDNSARVLDTRGGREITRLSGHELALTRAVYSRDGTTIATASRDRTVRLWNAQTGAPLTVLRGHSGAVLDVAFSPNGRLLATASEDGSARVWEVATGKERAVLLRQGTQDRLGAGSPRKTATRVPVTVRRISFSPDGWLIAAALSDGTARIWNATTMQTIATLRHDEVVRAIAFSPDSLRLVTASWDRTARLWDTQSGAQIGQPMVHNGWVQDAVFSPDGTKIVTASANPDTATRLWDGRTGAPLASFGDGPADVVRFNPAGTQILRVTKRNVQVVPIDVVLGGAGREVPSAARKVSRFAAIGDDGVVRLGAVSDGNIVEEGVSSWAPDIRGRGEHMGLSIDGKPIVDGRAIDGRAPIGTVFKDCGSCPEMIVLPPGRLQRTLGPPIGPQTQTVRLSRAIAVGRFEVTNAELRFGTLGQDGLRRPAVSVSWNQAIAYVKRLNELTGRSYRLLSEDEWEYAAGGVTDGRPLRIRRPGNIGAEKCCAGAVGGTDRWLGTAPVGQFAANDFGLFDMIGNVAEWVQDCRSLDISLGPNDGSAFESPECNERVVRGGGFLSTTSQAGIDAREFAPAEWQTKDIGLRVARELE